MKVKFRITAVVVGLLVGGCFEKQQPEVKDIQACIGQFYGPVMEFTGTTDCRDFVEIGKIAKVDQRLNGDRADVIATIDLTFKRSFHPNSNRADQCAGGMWSGFSENFRIGQTLQITKTFNFTKYQSGWRCDMRHLSPAENGRLLN